MSVYVRHGVPLTVRWDHPGLGDAVDHVLRHFGFEEVEPAGGGPGTDLVLELSAPSGGVHRPSGSAGAPLIRFGHLEVHRPFGSEVDAGVHVVGPGVRLELDPRSRAVRGWVEPRAWADWRSPDWVSVVALGIGGLFRHRDLHAIHAAALATPDGRGVMLVGPSGSGKTSTTLSLALAGWRLLSDDSLLLSSGEDGVEVLALRPGLYLAPEAARRYVELRGRWDDGPQPSGKARLEDGVLESVERVVPGRILYPVLTGETRSRIVPLDRVDALARLLRESDLVTLGPELGSAHLRALGRLADQAEHHELRAGTDLLGDPDHLIRVLGGARPADGPGSSVSAP